MVTRPQGLLGLHWSDPQSPALTGEQDQQPLESVLKQAGGPSPDP